MEKHFLLLVLFVVGMATISFAQNDDNPKFNNNWCGSSYEDNLLVKERLLKNRVEMANWVDTRTTTTYIPMKIHIVGNDTGADHVREVEVFNMLCTVNEHFADQDIQFYLKDGTFNYINNNTANVNPRSFAGEFQLGANKVNTALNIFIVKTIPSFGGGGGNTLAYFDSSSDWVVTQRDQVSTPAAETLTHELGHFFSLPHPFLGWDGEYWESAVHGNPVGSLSPGGTPNELVNGSNCATAGDGICDTAPNYGLGFGYGSCNYTGPVMDPNGALLKDVVQEENFMAYFLGCASEFTPDQKTAIALDLNSASRNYLNPGTTPNLDAINAAPNLVSPINGAVTPLYNVVGLDWDPVPGATHYLVEVDRLNNFSFAPSSKVVSGGTYVEFEDVFDSNRNYFWRVKPFNEGNPCGPVTTPATFKTGTVTAVNEIPSVKEWTVSPNPLRTEDVLNVEVTTDQAFDAQVKIFDMTGKLIETRSHNFTTGTSNLGLSVDKLSMGMYLLFIESEVGVMNQKIVITY